MKFLSCKKFGGCSNPLATSNHRLRGPWLRVYSLTPGQAAPPPGKGSRCLDKLTNKTALDLPAHNELGNLLSSLAASLDRSHFTEMNPRVIPFHVRKTPGSERFGHLSKVAQPDRGLLRVRHSRTSKTGTESRAISSSFLAFCPPFALCCKCRFWQEP